METWWLVCLIGFDISAISLQTQSPRQVLLGDIHLWTWSYSRLSQIEHTTELAVDALHSNITQGESDPVTLNRTPSGSDDHCPLFLLPFPRFRFTRRGRCFRASQIPSPLSRSNTPFDEAYDGTSHVEERMSVSCIAGNGDHFRLSLYIAPFVSAANSLSL